MISPQKPDANLPNEDKVPGLIRETDNQSKSTLEQNAVVSQITPIKIKRKKNKSVIKLSQDQIFYGQNNSMVEKIPRQFAVQTPTVVESPEIIMTR